jgi:TldD protein
MIPNVLAIEILNKSLETGGDFAEIFIEKSVVNSIGLEDGKIETSNSSLVNGAGIRILKGLQSVYGYSNDLSKKSLLKLADSLSKSFQGTPVKHVDKIETVKVSKNCPIKSSYAKTPKSKRIKILKECYEVAKGYDPRIVRVKTSFGDRIKDYVIFNSDGHFYEDSRSYGRLAISAVASDGVKIEAATSAPGAQKGFDYFEGLDYKDEAKKAAELAIQNLEAAECPSGRFPVIIGNGFGGVLFHEACGHPLEASSVSKNLSVFANKIGQPIASPIVTAIDDGTMEGGWGSINIDDEGHVAERTVLIENGILKEYMIDEFNGRRMGKPGNGHSRRESYKYEPTSRMTNTYIDNGESTVEEIIAATKLGLYAKSLGGGSVNPATGEFNFSCSEAYIVRDGKVAEQVKGATLIGTGAEVLKNIDMIANDLKHTEGMCGAASGSIFVTVGQPTLRVSEMTVGGRGGALK